MRQLRSSEQSGALTALAGHGAQALQGRAGLGCEIGRGGGVGGSECDLNHY